MEPHLVPAKQLADIVLRIVREEGPVHEDEVVNRVRDLWGLSRAGSRIQDSVAKAVRSLLVTKRCSRQDGFLSLPGTTPLIRSRENVNSTGLKKPQMLPPAELQASILAVIDAAHGIAGEELPTAVARAMGFKSTSQQFRAVLQTQRDALLKRGALEETEGFLKRVEREQVKL